MPKVADYLVVKRKEGVEYRISAKGKLQRRYGKHWKNICTHGVRRARCRRCGGSSFCTHGKQRATCRPCGGSSFCTHGVRRSMCRRCGGSSVCTHGKQRAQCVRCGGASVCTHGKQRAKCVRCGGTSVCACGVRVIQKDGFCTTCHPDWQPSVIGMGKSACECWDQLQIELDIDIQHGHYGEHPPHPKDEFRLPEYPLKAVDGYYAPKKMVFEFLGDHPHGHPGVATAPYNWRGQKLSDRYKHTQKVLQKVASFGYDVHYIWECDYRRYKADGSQSLWSYFRKFNGKLEHK